LPLEGVVVEILETQWPEKGSPEEEHYDALAAAFEAEFGLPFSSTEPPFCEEAGAKRYADRDLLGRAAVDLLTAHLEEKAKACNEMAEQYQEIGYPRFEWFQRDILMRILDTQWKDHLHQMDGLREGISLRGYAQKDPKVEYQREGYQLFQEMGLRVDQQAMELLFKFVLPEPRVESEVPRPVQTVRAGSAIEADPNAPQAAGGQKAGGKKGARDVGVPGKIGRNDPCHCGSGQKYKKCCGA